MTLALSFATPLLLIGLVATSIPFVLHLLSSVRAQEVYFPTLRFLRMSMEKTARRRRIQQWLLLLLRAGLLALLCLSVAEPSSDPTGGWFTGGGKGYVASIILDNSMSMAAEDGGSSRFSRAKMAAESLLRESDKPSMASLHVTNGAGEPTSLTADVGTLRDELTKTRLVACKALILPHLEQAVKLLAGHSDPRKSIFIFSDLQRISFDRLLDAQDLARSKDIHILIVDMATDEVKNVGITQLEIAGQRVAHAMLTFTATLVNSSATDRVVDVGLRAEGQRVLPLIRKPLRATGTEGGGNTATVQFHYRFDQARQFTGDVYIEQADDLKEDNVRRFEVTIGGPVEALVVRGQTDVGGMLSTDPVMALNLALNPHSDSSLPWPIKTDVVEGDQFATGDAAKQLAGKDILFFCEVPSFSDKQAEAIVSFAKAGGTVVFFLGPNVDVASYNRHFLASGKKEDAPDFLPGRIGEPVGELGPEAKASFVERIKLTSPYIQGLYTAKGEAGYRSVQVQRYFRLTRSPWGDTLATLNNGDELILFKFFGKGKVVLCGTTASPRWTTLPLNGLFLPLVNRLSLLARQQPADQVYTAGAKVTIVPDRLKSDTSAMVAILPPPDTGPAPKPIAVKKGGVDYTAYDLGIYGWEVRSANPDEQDDKPHRFVVNPDHEESDLRAFPAETLTRALARYGLNRVYIAKSLEGVEALAAKDSQGFPWWDIMAAGAILFLIAEAAVANRSTRKDEDLIPAHLNARLAA